MAIRDILTTSARPQTDHSAEALLSTDRFYSSTRLLEFGDGALGVTPLGGREDYEIR